MSGIQAESGSAGAGAGRGWRTERVELGQLRAEIKEKKLNSDLEVEEREAEAQRLSCCGTEEE